MNIEQRALDIITNNELLRKNTPKVRGAIRDALIQIATEQKAEDDKECETMVGVAVKECKQVMIDKACEWLGVNADKYIVDMAIKSDEQDLHIGGVCWQDFHKAMEE